MKALLPDGYVYDTPSEYVVFVRFSEETKDKVAAKLADGGYEIGGVHVYADKSRAFIVRVSKLSELESRLLKVEVDLSTNKAKIAELQTVSK